MVRPANAALLALVFALPFALPERNSYVQEQRAALQATDDAGDYAGMAKLALELLKNHSEAYAMDGRLPSVQHYLGVAMYNLATCTVAPTGRSSYR